tara:strand:- start:584 stop:961 length:378 start_codon:yes stop_codon:yes gene_type:complete
MSTRATYLFTNNSMAAEDICVYIHHDGYPTGAAEYFRKALFIAKTDRRPILEAFIAANTGAQITRSHQTHGDTEYRYTIDRKDVLVEKRISNFSEEHGLDNYWQTIFVGSIEEFIVRNIQLEFVS